MLACIVVGAILCLLMPDGRQLWKARKFREWGMMCAVLLLALACAILQTNGALYNPVEAIRTTFGPISEQVHAWLQ